MIVTDKHVPVWGCGHDCRDRDCDGCKVVGYRELRPGEEPPVTSYGVAKAEETKEVKPFIPCNFCGNTNATHPGRVLEHHESGSAICADCVAAAVLSLADYAQGVRQIAEEVRC